MRLIPISNTGCASIRIDFDLVLLVVYACAPVHFVHYLRRPNVKVSLISTHNREQKMRHPRFTIVSSERGYIRQDNQDLPALLSYCSCIRGFLAENHHLITMYYSKQARPQTIVLTSTSSYNRVDVRR